MPAAVAEVLSAVLGWGNFTAWFLAMYPQVLTNYRRKSVVGLHLDWLAYNVVGHTAYLAYNIAMLCSSTVRDEYYSRHPGSPPPVHVNDIAFSINATALTYLGAWQAMTYERGGQQVSRLCKSLLTFVCAAMAVLAVVCGAGHMKWLDMLMFMGAVKLMASGMKWVPQAVLNYQRKSTIGWDIRTNMCGLVGGSCAILQMTVDAIAADDASNFLGNYAKLGLATLTMSFDVLFLYQHFVLYTDKTVQKKAEYQALMSIDGTDSDDEEEDDMSLTAEP